jgi:hypothetical protein
MAKECCPFPVNDEVDQDRVGSTHTVGFVALLVGGVDFIFKDTERCA